MLKSGIKTKWSLAFIYEHETKKLKQTDNLPSLGARDLNTSSEVNDSNIPNGREGF